MHKKKGIKERSFTFLAKEKQCILYVMRKLIMKKLSPKKKNNWNPNYSPIVLMFLLFF